MLVQLFTETELSGIERGADSVAEAADRGELPAQCYHNSQTRGGGLKRTKFFFGARCEAPSILQ